MKHILLLKIIVVAIIIAPFSNLKAVKAYPHPIVVQQADGSDITIRLHGDEFFSYRTTTDGFLIKKANDGLYRYATHDKLGNIEGTKIIARNKSERNIFERTFVSGLEKNPNFRMQNMARRARKVVNATVANQTAFPLTGSPRSVAILVNFRDKKFVVADPKQSFERMLNQKDYSDNNATGSARDYFIESSMGAFSPQFDVIGPYDLPQDMEFYGGNNADGDDRNPRQMIIDACKVAETNGVDFKVYDTDNDGILDNVFVFYAGYNEAEGGPDNSVWPHRWSMSNRSSTVSGKVIFDYACTSELRSRSGSNMAGIGTFTHEFGHVLGLPDYYITDGESKHHTLNDWHIMDGGAYNNSGRTPPTYSAFDRFFLKWLTPFELTEPQNVELPNLVESNQAYIITADGNHNLVGNNPNPNEFFTLENRQPVGFDAFLPGKGMLVTRIFYNANTWRNNGPNNDVAAMGYDIVEADGIASSSSLPGDPFPGATNKTEYWPKLRNGTVLEKPLTEIQETDGLVRFLYLGGGNAAQIKLVSAFELFNTVQGTPSASDIVSINGVNLVDNIVLTFKNNEHFEMRLAQNTSGLWSKSLLLLPINSLVTQAKVEIRYNPTLPSILETHSDVLEVKTTKAFSKQINLTGKSTRQIFVIPPTANEAKAVNASSFVANWSPVFDASGYYLTAYSIMTKKSKVIEGFNNGLDLPANWMSNTLAITNSSTFSGKAIPALQFRNSGEFVTTETFMVPATSLSVYVRSIGATGGLVSISAWDESSWTSLEAFAPTANMAITKSYRFDVTKNYKKFKIEFEKEIGNVAIDDFEFEFDQRIDYIIRDKWTTQLFDTLRNLVPNTQHFYKVKASDRTLASDQKTLLYENITNWSNIVDTKTTDDPNESLLRANVDYTSGDITVVLPNIEHPVRVFSVSGKLIQIVPALINVVEIKNLARDRVYILQSGTRRAKVIL